MIEIPSFNLDDHISWIGLIVHHSATADGKDNDWEGIRKYHTSWRKDGEIINAAEGVMLKANKTPGIQEPWRDIGYHFGIERDNGDLIVRIGRPLSMVGAHCVGFNHSHIGLCIVGNFDKAEPDEEIWQASVKLARNIMYVFRFSRNNILGHRETFGMRGVPVEKTCPGAMFNLEKFRTEL